MVHHNVDPKALRIIPATTVQEDDRDLERACDVAIDDARNPETDVRAFFCEQTQGGTVVYGTEHETSGDGELTMFWERAA
jgi:hypothetical protein